MQHIFLLYTKNIEIKEGKPLWKSRNSRNTVTCTTSLAFSKNALCSVIRPSATAVATLARHGAYKKFSKKLLAREATRNAKRNARRKKVFAVFEVELDELPF